MRRAALLIALALLAGASQIVGAPVASALAEVSVVLDGHGNGHGIGMSQWGAYGYAVDFGWNADQILDHYYGGTVAGSVSVDTTVAVRLQNLDAAQTAVSVESGSLVVDGQTAGGWRSVLLRQTAPASYSVWARTDLVRCPSTNPADDPAAGGWTLLSAGNAGPLDVHTVADSTTISNSIQLAAVCEPTGTLRWYRGTIRALSDASHVARTVSVLPVEQYLRTVIAMEMSPSWAAAGGGNGRFALQAQAVAARSYALAQISYPPYANTCDMSCQAYYGVAYQVAGGNVRQVDYAQTDAAVAATAGVVRRIPDPNNLTPNTGVIALTMFSASNGGYSAVNTHLLTPFPAVPDAGDATAANPWHNWTVTLTGATIAARYPSIGTFTDLTVLSRNSYGEWGGRVTSLSVAGTAGAVTVTGSAFRSALGLRDTWFNVRGSLSLIDLCQNRIPPALVGPMAVAPGAKMTPLAPHRLIDTRDGTGTTMLPLIGGCTLVVNPGLDPSVTAVAVNLTSVNTASNGYLTAYPCGVSRPLVSAVQTVAGRVIAGMAIVPLGTDGTFCIFANTTTDVVIDLFGSYAPGSGSNYEPVLPARVFDSGAVRPAGVMRVHLAGTPRVPVTATGVVLTVHSIGATRDGFATIYPCTAAVPLVSSVNATKGLAITNQVQVQLSSSGDVCVYINVPMRIYLDVGGWFGPTASTLFYAISPVRTMDTRINLGLAGRFGGGVNRALTLAGTSGLPDRTRLRAVVAEVTAVDAFGAGYVTVHPCMAPLPNVSAVRFVARTNAATTVAGGDDAAGRWCLVSTNAVHVLVDVSGYFA